MQAHGDLVDCTDINSRPDPSGRRAFFRDIDQALWGAANAVKEWPLGVLFANP
jgi:hypothetical protein